MKEAVGYKNWRNERRSGHLIVSVVNRSKRCNEMIPDSSKALSIVSGLGAGSVDIGASKVLGLQTDSCLRGLTPNTEGSRLTPARGVRACMLSHFICV